MNTMSFGESEKVKIISESAKVILNIHILRFFHYTKKGHNSVINEFMGLKKKYIAFHA